MTSIFPSMYNKISVRFGFCDISNDQSLGTGLSASAGWLRMITITSTLIILDITKTSSNNCLSSVSYRSHKICKQRNVG